MTITLAGFILITLAAARITRLVTTDTITAPLRDRFARRALNAYKADLAAVRAAEQPEAPEGVDAAVREHTEPDPASVVKSPTERGLYAGLICSWCVGFWVVAASFAVYYLTTAWPDTTYTWFVTAAEVLAASWLVGALNNRYAR